MLLEGSIAISPMSFHLVFSSPRQAKYNLSKPTVSFAGHVGLTTSVGNIHGFDGKNAVKKSDTVQGLYTHSSIPCLVGAEEVKA